MSDTITLTDEPMKEYSITEPKYICKKHGEAEDWLRVVDKQYCLECLVDGLQPMECVNE